MNLEADNSRFQQVFSFSYYRNEVRFFFACKTEGFTWTQKTGKKEAYVSLDKGKKHCVFHLTTNGKNKKINYYDDSLNGHHIIDISGDKMLLNDLVKEMKGKYKEMVDKNESK